MKVLTDSLRVAVVGLGKMGLLHASLLNVLPNVQVIALCERSFLTRRFLKKVFKGKHIVDDVEKLSNLDLDAVYVTTPIPSHFPIAKTLYSRKIAKNLFVEKTLAASYDEAKELCELARCFGKGNMVGYVRRFAVTFKKAREILLDDAIGQPTFFEAYARSSDFLGSERNSRKPASRGGVLGDLGCHVVDLALWYFGELRVEGARLQSLVGNSSEDIADFEVRNSNGLKGRFSVSWCVENYRMPEAGLSIAGPKGMIDVNDDRLKLKLSDGKSFTWYRHDLQDNVPFFLGGSEFYREDKYFVKSVIKDSNAEPSFYTASRVDQIIEQVKNRTGKIE